MSRRFISSVLPILGILLATAPIAMGAEDFLQLVPGSAWGFITVNSPMVADTKINDLNRELQLPIADPLAAFKQVTGIQTGLDEKSAVAYLFLPPETEGDSPARVMLLPVTNYATFLDGLNAKSKTDEVTEVLFSHNTAVIRNIGGYAALTKPEHRKSLESLKLANEVPSSLKPWRQWISAHDAAAVILQPGIKNTSAKAQSWLAAMKMMLGSSGEQGKQAAVAFEMYDKMLQACEKEVSASGIGLQLDKENVLRVTSRTELVSAGNWAKFLAQAPSPKENLLKGLPGVPFVAAGGVVPTNSMMDVMLKLSFDVMKSMLNMYDLNDEQIAKLSQELTTNFQGLRSMSMMLGVGKSDEPLYANLFSIMRVDNAQSFMTAYEKYCQRYNEIIAGGKGPMIQPMEIEKCEVAGAPALQIKMAIPQSQAGPMPAQYDKMIEGMIGRGGKLLFWIAAADKHTVIAGYVNKGPLERTIVSLKQKSSGLTDNADLSNTAALLPTGAPVIAYLSPQGTVELIKRMVVTMLPPEKQAHVKIPAFAQSPPLGFAVKAAPGEVQTTLVVPAETLKAIGKYVKDIQGMSGNGVTANP
jgi:hypothetical protein